MYTNSGRTSSCIPFIFKSKRYENIPYDFFLPVVIAPVAISLMFSLFTTVRLAYSTKFWRQLVWEDLQQTGFPIFIHFLYAVMVPQVWQYIGLYVTIFLGALQSMPEELSESAQIDGANRTQTFSMLFYLKSRISQIYV